MVRNVTHITVNSGDAVVYPNDSVIFDEMKPVMQDMVEQARETGIISVMDDEYGRFSARCTLDLEKGIYTATLYNEEAPELSLLETAGVLNAEAGKEIWEQMKELHKASWRMEAPNMKCPKEPFICDLFYLPVIFTPWIARWSGDFTKCFGISMLNMMLQYKKMPVTEESSNRL